jgi:hypothetical protein
VKPHGARGNIQRYIDMYITELRESLCSWALFCSGASCIGGVKAARSSSNLPAGNGALHDAVIFVLPRNFSENRVALSDCA